jgi:hypothetical protein
MDEQMKQAQDMLKMLQGIGNKEPKGATNRDMYNLIEETIAKFIKSRGNTVTLQDSEALLNLRKLSKDYE